MIYEASIQVGGGGLHKKGSWWKGRPLLRMMSYEVIRLELLVSSVNHCEVMVLTCKGGWKAGRDQVWVLC